MDQRVITGYKDIDVSILKYLTYEHQMLRLVSKSWNQLLKTMETAEQIIDPKSATETMIIYFMINDYENCIKWLNLFTDVSKMHGYSESLFYNYYHLKGDKNSKKRSDRLVLAFIVGQDICQEADELLEILSIKELIRLSIDKCLEEFGFDPRSAKIVFEIAQAHGYNFVKYLTGQSLNVKNLDLREKLFLALKNCDEHHNELLRTLIEFGLQDDVLQYIRSMNRPKSKFENEHIGNELMNMFWAEAFKTKCVDYLDKYYDIYGFLPKDYLNACNNEEVEIQDCENPCSYCATSVECLKWAMSKGVKPNKKTFVAALNQERCVFEYVKTLVKVRKSKLSDMLPSNISTLEFCKDLLTNFGRNQVLFTAVQEHNYDVILWCMRQGFSKTVWIPSKEEVDPNLKDRLGKLGFEFYRQGFGTFDDFESSLKRKRRYVLKENEEEPKLKRIVHLEDCIFDLEEFE